MGRSVMADISGIRIAVLTLSDNTAYYNAGSAALVLVLIALAIGGFLWWRLRRNRLRGLPTSPQNSYEENIPLTESSELEYPPEEPRSRKGKERALSLPSKEEIFRVDDSDDEDTRTPRTGH